METIGEKIYNLRKEKCISQEKLAEILNVSRQTVSRWETDSARPTEQNIKSLCSVFGVDRSCLTAGESAAVETKPANTKDGFTVFAVAAISVFLVCCIAACIVASYVSFMPSYANGLNNAAAHRFRYLGIVCVSFGALAAAMLACLLGLFIKRRVKIKK